MHSHKMISLFPKVLLSLSLILPSLSVAESSLEPLPPFSWGSVMMTPPLSGGPGGYQVLHFKTKNKPYTQSKEAIHFVQTYLSDVSRYESDAEVLRVGSDAVTLDGAYIEAGVGAARTINFIAALNPRHKIYGFDSFEGLPKKWDRPDASFPKHTFAFKGGYVPAVLANVVLYKGLFTDTIPAFKKKILGDKPVAFLHIDCDIYESTKDVLSGLKDNIVPGTVIVFDELYNYPGCEKHEWKALQEFLREKSLDVEFIAFNIMHEQVALKVVAFKEKS